MKAHILKLIAFLLAIAVITAGCSKKSNNVVDELTDKEMFCLYLNEENLDQTIPIVNQYLSRLSPTLNEEQQLVYLTAWLQTCSCIIYAALEQPDTNKPQMREIIISFDENGIIKNFILNVSLIRPLKAKGYREYEVLLEKFCSFVNVKNLDKTLPIIDKYLSGFPVYWDNEQKVQTLVDWLKSQLCIVNANVFCRCVDTDPLVSEILISFDENGITKDFILELSMTQPLKIRGYHEYEETVYEFCSFVNVKDIDKTKPFMDKFLSRLPDNLPAEQQLQALVTWLKSQPCIIDASVVYNLTIYKAAWKYIMKFSFEEKGITEDVLLYFSDTQPLKLLGHHVGIYYYYDIDYSLPSYPYAKFYKYPMIDKIALIFQPPYPPWEQLLAILNSDPSLRSYESEQYLKIIYDNKNNGGYSVEKELSCILQTKNGNPISLSTLQFFKEKPEIDYVNYAFNNRNEWIFCWTLNYFVVTKPKISDEKLQELAIQNNCKVQDMLYDRYHVYVSKYSKFNVVQMSALFYETGFFGYSYPTFRDYCIICE